MRRFRYILMALGGPCCPEMNTGHMRPVSTSFWCCPIEADRWGPPPGRGRVPGHSRCRRPLPPANSPSQECLLRGHGLGHLSVLYLHHQTHLTQAPTCVPDASPGVRRWSCLIRSTGRWWVVGGPARHADRVWYTLRRLQSSWSIKGNLADICPCSSGRRTTARSNTHQRPSDVCIAQVPDAPRDAEQDPTFPQITHIGFFSSWKTAEALQSECCHPWKINC